MFFKNLSYYIKHCRTPLADQPLFQQATKDHALYAQSLNAKFDRFAEEQKDKPTYSIEFIRGKYSVKKKRLSACVPISAPKDNYTIIGKKVLVPSEYESYKARLAYDLEIPIWQSMIELSVFENVLLAEQFVKDDAAKMQGKEILYYNDAGERVDNNA